MEDFFLKLEDIEEECEDLWASITFSTGSANDIDRVISKFEGRERTGIMFYTFSLKLDRAILKLERFGFDLDFPYADEDTAGFIFIFIEALDDIWSESSIESSSDSGLYESEYDSYYGSEGGYEDLCGHLSTLGIEGESYHHRGSQGVVSHHHHHHLIELKKKKDKLVCNICTDFSLE